MGVPVFATTHWSVVLQAGEAGSPASHRALEELCRTYWHPLYAYARRLGHDAPASEDLTQGFFARLLEKNYLTVVDRRRGKFRWFLLTAFKGFLANEWDRERALKRGGGQALLPLDITAAEDGYQHEPTDGVSADQVYEHRWALTLLESVRERLQQEYNQAGKAQRFALLEEYLPGERIGRSYAETAEQLGMTEGAVKVEVHRIKKRYAELLRAAVQQTVASPQEVDEELRYLFQIFARK